MEVEGKCFMIDELEYIYKYKIGKLFEFVVFVGVIFFDVIEE